MKLPPLLEERRVKFEIPDVVFGREAVFDRVLIYQISDFEGDTYSGTNIVMTEKTKQRKLAMAPRGIVISAGLHSRDALVSNGCNIGSIVNFVRLSPWRLEVGIHQAKTVELHLVRVGDIVACEDLAAERDSGAVEIKMEAGQHRVVRADGTCLEPLYIKPNDDY